MSIDKLFFFFIYHVFTGIGYSIILTSILGSSIYMLVLSWSIFYFFDSFRSDVQWQYCHHEFNSPSKYPFSQISFIFFNLATPWCWFCFFVSSDCFSNAEFDACLKVGGTYYNHTCFNSTDPVYSHLNHTPVDLRITASAEYFEWVFICSF